LEVFALIRIALIHALLHSVTPINDAFIAQWPAAIRMNLLDDSLSTDLTANAGVLDATMHARFETLARMLLSSPAQPLVRALKTSHANTR
jgi:hypothetical protein